MDDDRYPTDEELKRIREWDYKDGFEGLAELILSIWHWPDYAELKDWKTDEFRNEYREFRLGTGGWSGNEDIISAMSQNTLFWMLCWESSRRGGLYIFRIPKVE